jgi:hypothetical protein
MYYYAFSNVYHGSNVVFGLLNGMSAELDAGHAGKWVVIPEPVAAAAVIFMLLVAARGSDR